MSIVSLAMVYWVSRADTCEGKKKHLFLIMLNIRYTQYIISHQNFRFHQFVKFYYTYNLQLAVSQIYCMTIAPGLDLIVVICIPEAGKKPNDLYNTKHHGDM